LCRAMVKGVISASNWRARGLPVANGAKTTFGFRVGVGFVRQTSTGRLIGVTGFAGPGTRYVTADAINAIQGEAIRRFVAG